MDISLIIFLIGAVCILLFVIATRNNPISGVVIVIPNNHRNMDRLSDNRIYYQKNNN